MNGPDATTIESAPNAGAEARDASMGGATALMMRFATTQWPLGLEPCAQTICPGKRE